MTRLVKKNSYNITAFRYTNFFLSKTLKNQKFYNIRFDLLDDNIKFKNLPKTQIKVSKESVLLSYFIFIIPRIYKDHFLEVVVNINNNFDLNKIKSLTTDSYFIENDYYKILSLLLSHKKIKSNIFFHGGSFFYDTDSWIFSKNNYYAR